ncbi:hypothetical protein [Burkholderia territorii]|uniref:hypothetical protein n=1 Tax=Burkholderia territorii TaxID=1503055 RepID=UPI0012D8D9AE|nr:hypothetical protein [Burkholderia territorii]
MLPNNVDLTILGTFHGVEHINKIQSGPQLAEYLAGQTYNHVFTETGGVLPDYRGLQNLSNELTDVHNRPASIPAQETRLQKLRREKGWEQLDSTADRNRYGYDDVLASVALRQNGGSAVAQALESEQTRLAHALSSSNVYSAPKTQTEIDLDMQLFYSGQEQDSWKKYANNIISTGNNIMNVELRNDQWVSSILNRHPNELTSPERIFWVVGGNHVPGLLVGFKEHGANIEPIDVFNQRHRESNMRSRTDPGAKDGEHLPARMPGPEPYHGDPIRQIGPHQINEKGRMPVRANPLAGPSKSH